MRILSHGTPASADGQNRAAAPRFHFHPPGETERRLQPHINALILISEFSQCVTRSAFYLGNRGSIIELVVLSENGPDWGTAHKGLRFIDSRMAKIPCGLDPDGRPAPTTST